MEIWFLNIKFNCGELSTLKNIRYCFFNHIIILNSNESIKFSYIFKEKKYGVPQNITSSL